MGDACASVGEVQSPIETENNNEQQKRYDDVVDWLDGGDATTDGKAGDYHTNCMA